MNYLTIDAKSIEAINFLYKHLFDDPAQNPVNIPKITPNGIEVTNIKQLSSLLGVDTNTASYYVIQDPTSPNELKSQAKEVINPGIFVASDDAYLPVTHKAYEIMHNPHIVEEKRIRMVRTISGVRRFKQRAGSIIVNDGESPLDALTALKNDVPGYEKVGSKSGGVFYVGREKGKWVVRDPLNGTIIHSGDKEEDTYKWLNTHAGGSETTSSEGKKPTQASQVLGRVESSQSRLTDEQTLAKDKTLTVQQARLVNKLTTPQLAIYRGLRERGIDHDTALKLAVVLKPKPTRKKK